MRKLIVSLLLVFTLTTGILVASHVAESVTGTEHKAEAFHGGWHPTWGCMMGTTLIGLGVIHTAAVEPPPNVDWRFLYGLGLEAAGAWLTLSQCFQELYNHHASANTCVKYPSYSVRTDSRWLWPGFWWHASNWRSMPCTVKTLP